MLQNVQWILMSVIFGIDLINIGIYGMSAVACVSIAFCALYFALTTVAKRMGWDTDDYRETEE